MGRLGVLARVAVGGVPGAIGFSDARLEGFVELSSGGRLASSHVLYRLRSYAPLNDLAECEESLVSTG